MRILYYSAHPHLNLSSPSGPGTHMREMIKGFKGLGHEVELFIAGGESEAAGNSTVPVNSSGLRRIVKRILPSGIWETIKDIKLQRFDRRLEKELDEKIRSFKPELIYERAYYMMVSGVRSAKRNNIRHILEMNAPFVEEKKYMTGGSGLLKSKALALEEEQVRGTDRLVVVSSALKDHFIKKYSLAENKICVCPNAVDPEQVCVNENAVAELKKEFKMNTKEICIGFVGSVFPYHGLDNLVQAFSKITKERTDLRLIIVGDGETLPLIKQMAQTLNCADKIVFTGNVKHSLVFNYIALMDIAVMARSNWYGSPVKIFEYGIMGKAIIAPDNVPLRDVMVNGEDGLLIDETVKGLEKALERMINDKPSREKMGIDFQKKVREKHTWKNMAAITLSGITK